MERLAFTMKLFRGCVDEYKKRHDAIWPELIGILKKKGISNYSIFLDELSLTLFGYLTVEKANAMDQIGQELIVQRWWDYMKDIMETNEDNSPVLITLKEVFHLP